MLRDLTLEKPSRAVITFSLPLVLSTVLQQTYNIANSVIVGRMVGSAALASVGAAYPITLFYIAVATGARWPSVVISAGKEARDMKSARYLPDCFVLLGITCLRESAQPPDYETVERFSEHMTLPPPISPFIPSASLPMFM